MAVTHERSNYTSIYYTQEIAHSQPAKPKYRMLIQVLQRTKSGLKKVNEYYWWRVPLGYEMSEQEYRSLDQVAKIDCPGCGRFLNRQTIRWEHQCPGTLTEHPVVPGRLPILSQKSEREQRLLEYLRNNPNAQVGNTSLTRLAKKYNI